MYGVRIIGPEGLVHERGKLAGSRFRYPESATALTAGVRYRFQLLAPWQPPQEVWFEVVEPEVARQIRRDLRDLEEALAPALSPATLATLRAGFPAHSGLLHDARLGVAEELARRPEEPTLHFLLGNLYARQGLSREAAASFAEVSLLMSGAVSAR